MSRLFLTSDLHLGHKNICKYRKQFKTVEEHDAIVFDNLASAVNKRDSVYFMGDIAFTLDGLEKIKSLNVKSKVLLLGNHDIERGIKMAHIMDTYDKVFSLHSKRNVWFSHCPIHPSEMRDRKGNVHGHGHKSVIDDPRYFSVCLEHTNYKPVLFSQVVERFETQ